jgi:hypothetical protein
MRRLRRVFSTPILLAAAEKPPWTQRSRCPVLLAAQQEEESFGRAIAVYMEVHRRAAAEVPSVTADTPETVQMIELALARRIQAGRPNARAGDILGPFAERIRNLVQEDVTGPQGSRMLSSIRETNVYGARVRVNHRHPAGLPRVTMPGPMLTRLPTVPADLDYRFLGRSLLLIDTRAGLIVDVLPAILPVETASMAARRVQ